MVSPIVDALEELYVKPRPDGRTYVLYAPPTQGKTSGAKYFLETHFLQFTGPEEAALPDPQGIMITGGADSNYFEYMAKVLGAGNCKSWMYSLIAALMPDPKAPMRLPSVLLLDNFNIDSEENLYFLRKLFVASNECHLYTVVMTQNKELANKMCALNGGKKIAPLPSAMAEETLPGALADDSWWKDPKWTNLEWKNHLLSEMINLRFPNQFEVDDGEGFMWVHKGLTPLDAIWAAEEKLKQKRPISPPKRKKMKFEEPETNAADQSR